MIHHPLSVHEIVEMPYQSNNPLPKKYMHIIILLNNVVISIWVYVFLYYVLYWKDVHLHSMRDKKKRNRYSERKKKRQKPRHKDTENDRNKSSFI